ncbi:MAG: fuconate dehydratase [Acidimicrobiales bacterium]|nr:fuconate dehydratase [Acidimicrobiales bacterium]
MSATPRITGVEVVDVRAPTSRWLHGSDAVHRDPDYSAAYVVAHTDLEGLAGYGLAFTLGRGTEVVCAAVEALAHHVVGVPLDELTGDLAGLQRRLTGDTQLRWLGPEKGVIHLATAALVNAVWDLWARVEAKPVWKLVVDLEPERLADCLDWRYLSDALTRDEAVSLLRSRVPGRAEREAELRRDGYPAYLTSAGWLGYDDELVRQRLRVARHDGWTRFKVKVGIDPDADVRRLGLVRGEIGWDADLMVDANQVWDVPQAIEWTRRFTPFRLRWVEEPTSPDDVLGHAAIRGAVAPIGVATGEHVANRVVFKQLLQAGAIDYCQVDACRLGGLTEVLTVVVLAAHYGVPVCPHAGGLGLCEYVQHVSLIDYVAVSADLDGRMCEYAEHLHEQFVHPAEVRRGSYVVPEAAGFSVELRPEAIDALRFPDGAEWRDRGRAEV